MTRSPLMTTCSIFAFSLSLSICGAVAQEMPSQKEMWEMILSQQAQIEKLEQIIGANNNSLSEARKNMAETQKDMAETQKKVAKTEQKIEATGDVLDHIMSTGATGSQSTTSIGGYLDLHYNGGKADLIDLHRFVIFLSHEFNEKIRFFSELEIEHTIAGEGQVGDVKLEQAFLEMDISENHRAGIGLQLVPIGILNEIHEPPTFYGVERNNVERNIIPTTWWEAGIKLSGNLSQKITYDLMMHSGLDTTGTGYKIRSGRQKVALAPWKNTAFTARAKWQAAPGIAFATSFQYQSDITQSSLADEKASATLFEVNANITRAVTQNGHIGLRALFAQWNVNALSAEILGRDKQRGWYVEPAYKITLDDERAVGIFARYSQWDNEAGDNIDSLYQQTAFGLNYWPHENVVLKVDYQIDSFANNAQEDNRINLGMGLQF